MSPWEVYGLGLLASLGLNLSFTVGFTLSGPQFPLLWDGVMTCGSIE